MNRMFGVNLDLKSSTNTQIQKNENIITSMVYMSIVMFYQKELMTKTVIDVNLIIDQIETHTVEKDLIEIDPGV